MSIQQKKLSKHSPSEIEQIRTSLAQENNIRDFYKTYEGNMPMFNNKNSRSLWDEKFFKEENIENQDAMTREKISFIANQFKSLKQPIKLLDIGIGQAFLEQELEKRNIRFKLSAIDISKLSIERAKKYKAKAVIDDALSSDKHFERKSFDAIVAIEVIEHISPNKIFSFYEKVHKLLKSDGLFIISTPLNEGLQYMKNNPNAHVREYSIPILNKEFELANFKIVNTKKLIAFNQLYLVKKLISKVFVNRWKPNNIILIAKKV